MKPFADVLDQPGLYDETRRRAKARRSRRTALVSAVSAAVIALGAGLLVSGTGSHKAEPLGADVTDQQLVAMSGCAPDCEVLDRVALSGDRTFAAIGRFYVTLNPTGGPAEYTASAFVLAHGDAMLDVRSATDWRFGFVRDARTDSTGNVLVPMSTGTELWFLPFSTTGDRLSLPLDPADTRQTSTIGGTTASGFSDHDHDGRWEMVTYRPTPRCESCVDAASWTWRDTGAYVSEACTSSTSQTVEVAARGCGTVEVPPLATPSPEPQPTVTESVDPSPLTDADLVARAHLCNGCAVQARLELPDGRTFAVLGRGEQREYLLARGHRVIDELEEVPGHLAAATLLEQPRADDTGNVILRLGQDGKQWFLPLSLKDDQIALTNSNQGSPPITSDASAGFADRNGDGKLELVVRHATTWQSWSWHGATYEAESCLPEYAVPFGYRGPASACGAPSYSDQPGWYAKAGCPSGCTNGPVAVLGSGHTLRVLTNTDGYKLVLTDGETYLGGLPADGFTADRAGALHTDSTGHALLEAGGNTAHWIIPIGESGDRPVVLQGGLDQHLAFDGDSSTTVKDTNGDGVLEILVGNHVYATASAPYRSSTTTYSWNGTRYEQTGCTGNLCS